MSVIPYTTKSLAPLAQYIASIGAGQYMATLRALFVANQNCLRQRYHEDSHSLPSFEFIQEPKERISQSEALDLLDGVISNSVGDKQLLQTWRAAIYSGASACGDSANTSELVGRWCQLVNGCTRGYVVALSNYKQCVVAHHNSEYSKVMFSSFPANSLTLLSDIPLGSNQVAFLAEQRLQEQQNEQYITELKSTSGKWFNELLTTLADGKQYAIVAERHINTSDTHTDYWGSKCVESIVLAFSAHKRNLFSEFRKAAALADQTRHLSDKDTGKECRENYSMGAGTYVTDGNRYSGWQIRKQYVGSIGTGSYIIPSMSSSILNLDDGDSTNKAGTLGPSQNHLAEMKLNDLKCGIELHFVEKPSPQILKSLRDSEFRYHRKLNFWYAKQTPNNLSFANGIAANPVGDINKCKVPLEVF